MKITVLDSGFVSLDSIKPVGYAGEMNSRKLDIIHPLFTDCYYQLLVMRNGDLYTLGVENGVAEIPPSLLRSATTLQCQFVAMSTPTSIVNSETDTFVFKSSDFKLTVAQGLNIGNAAAVPPYEQLQDIYKEINEAKQAVDKAKKDNEQILVAIQTSLDKVKQTPVIDLEQKFREEYQKQLDEISSEYFDQFVESITEEVMNRIEEVYPPHDCCECCKPSDNTDPSPTPPCPSEIDIDKLKELIRQIIAESASKIKLENRYSRKSTHSMSESGDIIGG